jgi:hypothetical protein
MFRVGTTYMSSLSEVEAPGKSGNWSGSRLSRVLAVSPAFRFPIELRLRDPFPGEREECVRKHVLTRTKRTGGVCTQARVNKDEENGRSVYASTC